MFSGKWKLGRLLKRVLRRNSVDFQWNWRWTVLNGRETNWKALKGDDWFGISCCHFSEDFRRAFNGTICYFAPYFSEHESKIFFSIAPYRTFFHLMFAFCVHTQMMIVHVSDRENFFQKIAVNVLLNATEIVRRSFPKSLNVAIFFSKMSLKWYYFLKMSFHFTF